MDEFQQRPVRDPADLLRGQGRLLQVKSGTAVYHAGDSSEAIYLIQTGRIRIVVDVDGEPVVVRESTRGELIGTLGLFTNQPRSSTAVAVRDTELRRVERAEFVRLMHGNPGALWRFGQLCVENMQRRHSAADRRYRDNLRTLAVIPAHDDLPMRDIVSGLLEELARRGSCLHLNARQLDERLGEGASSVRVEDREANARVANWLNEQEHTNRYLLYEGDSVTDSAWTRRCLRQADRVLVVARPDRPARLSSDLLDYLQATVHAPVECVYLNDFDEDAPLTPWAWREACQAEVHHWLDLGVDRPLARIARMICGEAVGVVLGGGGARGFAHLGLLRALAERDIAVDIYGGTSMGALVAALAAAGRSIDDIELALRELFVDKNNLNDYTVPRVSLIAARKLRRKFEVLFGGARIEMLPQPFFCVSTNITRGESVVHERGPVAHWVGASMSVPGIAPPVAFQGDLLVDGAVLNNVPSDIMQELGRGPVIASDVTAAENLDIPGLDSNDSQPRQLKRQGRQPNIFKILFRSATLLSPEVRAARAQSADLYLRMPIAGVGMFDWNRIDEIVEAATVYSRAQLDTWLAAKAAQDLK